ncbi:MAG TPA: Uma2 family endonuclease [Tepidisphaeraceae bacterium]|jgi:Uma2 family endonuclease|nr:Uma2 family endonuclease [Tepidisphaeraceae bacterium]
MTISTISVTAEELWAMPGDERRELVRGEVRTMAPAGFDHGAITNNLAFLLTAFTRGKSLGQILGAETGFILARNPDVVRGPDVAFVQASRIPASGRPVKFWEGAPDLAVKVVSPSDTLEDVEEKVDDYLAAGTRMVWIVNPRRRTITVHRPGSNPVVLREADTLDGQDVLPGFHCGVHEAFL